MVNKIGEYKEAIEIQRSVRYRLAVSRSVKNVVTPDYTVETVGHTMEEMLALQAAFRAEVDKRYPPPLSE